MRIFLHILCFITTGVLYCTSRPVAQAYLKVQRLVDEYILHHSTLNFENATDICSRKFIVATYDFPEQMGNRMHSFLNGFLVAIITNRTLLWERGAHWGMYLSGDSKTESSDPITLERKDWLSISGRQAFKILQTAGCPVDPSVPYVISEDRWTSEERIACCGIDQISDRVIALGELEGHHAFSLFRRGAVLGSIAQQRVTTLKSISESSLYGLLFLCAFSFSREVASINDQVLQKYENTEILSIGIHVRHQNTKDDGEDVSEIVKCVWQILNNPNSRLPCVLFVASDRINTFNSLKNLSSTLNCDIVGSKKIIKSGFTHEHGLWGASGSTILDVELLSRADYFIGTPWSTFSWLIESVFAYSNLLSPVEETVKWESQLHCDGKAKFTFQHPDSYPPWNCSYFKNDTSFPKICPK